MNDEHFISHDKLFALREIMNYVEIKSLSNLGMRIIDKFATNAFSHYTSLSLFSPLFVIASYNSIKLILH